MPYSLQGILSVHEDAISFNTADGRVFNLIIDRNTAKKFHGQPVKINALAVQSDDLQFLKVKKIDLIDSKSEKIFPPPFKQGQRPPKLFRSESGKKIVHNVRWDIFPASGTVQHSWETVTVKPDLVKNVYFIKKPFPPELVAAHSLILFTFEKGGMIDSKGRESQGLGLSIEAYQRVDQKYSLLKGMKNEFQVVWLLVNWENYLEQSCKFSDEKLILYSVKLSKSQKISLVHESIKQACVDRQGEFYHTITNNCTNNLIILFNHVLEKERQVKMWAIPSMIYNLRATMPAWVPAMLQKKGIISKPFPEINRSTWGLKWAKNPDDDSTQ